MIKTLLCFCHHDCILEPIYVRANHDIDSWSQPFESHPEAQRFNVLAVWRRLCQYNSSRRCHSGKCHDGWRSALTGGSEFVLCSKPSPTSHFMNVTWLSAWRMWQRPFSLCALAWDAKGKAKAAGHSGQISAKGCVSGYYVRGTWLNVRMWRDEMRWQQAARILCSC